MESPYEIFLKVTKDEAAHLAILVRQEIDRIDGFDFEDSDIKSLQIRRKGKLVIISEKIKDAEKRLRKRNRTR